MRYWILVAVIILFASVLVSTIVVLSAPDDSVSRGTRAYEICQSDTDCPPYQFCNLSIEGGFCQNKPVQSPGNYIVVPPTEQNCADSDGGLNYDAFGKVTIFTEEFKDFCLNETLLQEGFCDNNIPKSIKYDCRSEGGGCLDGECTDACIDTDPTNDMSVKGKVIYRNTILDDSCLGGVSGSARVVKNYCDRTGVPDFWNIRCPFGETCYDGRCTISVSSPDSDHTLEILSDVKVPLSPLEISIGGKSEIFGIDFIDSSRYEYRGHFVYNSADPIIYSKPIVEYTNEKFYNMDEWRIITEYDDRMCMVNVRDSDSSHKLTAYFELTGSTADGVEERLEKYTNCKPKGDGLWDCYAKFPPAKDLRTLKYTCTVTVKDDKGISITATSEPAVVARYVYPVVRVNEEEFNLLGFEFNEYKKISELLEISNDQISNPKLSSKAVYYDVNIPVEAKELTTNFLLFKSFDFSYYKKIIKGLGIGFDPNWPKGDRLIVISDFLVNNSGTFASEKEGFTWVNYPAVYIRSSVNPNSLLLIHELGHAYPISLCDEYNKIYYTLENILLLPSGGCPNKLPDIERVYNIGTRLDVSGFYAKFQDDWMKTTLLYELKDGPCQFERSIFFSPDMCKYEFEKRAKEEYGEKLKEIEVTIQTVWSSAFNKQIDSIHVSYELDPAARGSVMDGGNFYPEVNQSHPLHQYYCPLKDCG